MNTKEYEYNQFVKNTQKHLYARVDKLFEYAWDEFGNRLGDIDTFNCKKNKLYLEGYNGVTYKGIRDQSVDGHWYYFEAIKGV